MKWRWVIGIVEGKFVLLGPYPPEPDSTADTIAMEKFEINNSEIFTSPYRDAAKVTRNLKEGRIRLENVTIVQALERVKHNV